MTMIDDPDILKQVEERGSPRKSMLDNDGVVDTFIQPANGKRNIDDVDEANEGEADIFRQHKPDMILDDSDNKMVYVPKQTVIEYMKKVETESNERIKKYRDYAKEMKQKFGDYEDQSEKYYSEMLEKFKAQARNAVNKKQRELNALLKLKEEHEAEMDKIRGKIKERKIRAFFSDEEESEEEEDTAMPIKREADMEEYVYVKANRKRAKVAIVKFVRKFREENDGKDPTDADTGPVAMELADFNHLNEQYLDIKLNLIKASKMPFQPDEFSGGSIGGGAAAMGMTKGPSTVTRRATIAQA